MFENQDVEKYQPETAQNQEAKVNLLFEANSLAKMQDLSASGEHKISELALNTYPVKDSQLPEFDRIPSASATKNKIVTLAMAGGDT